MEFFIFLIIGGIIIFLACGVHKVGEGHLGYITDRRGEFRRVLGEERVLWALPYFNNFAQIRAKQNLEIQGRFTTAGPQAVSVTTQLSLSFLLTRNGLEDTYEACDEDLSEESLIRTIQRRITPVVEGQGLLFTWEQLNNNPEGFRRGVLPGVQGQLGPLHLERIEIEKISFSFPKEVEEEIASRKKMKEREKEGEKEGEVIIAFARKIGKNPAIDAELKEAIILFKEMKK